MGDEFFWWSVIKFKSSNENYILQRSTQEIIKTPDFIIPLVIAAVIFLALAIALAFVIFKKKKPATYVPPYQKVQQKQSQPEQFSREVFDVVDYDEVEETPENPTSEE